MVGRIQHHHNETQQKVGRKVIWTLRSPWKGRTHRILPLTPHYVEKDPSSFQQGTPNPLQTPCLPPATQPAPPMIVKGDEEYKVDEILDSWMRSSKLQYLVHWKDYPFCTNWTWEPESNITLETPGETSETNLPRNPKKGKTQSKELS